MILLVVCFSFMWLSRLGIQIANKLGSGCFFQGASFFPCPSGTAIGLVSFYLYLFSPIKKEET